MVHLFRDTLANRALRPGATGAGCTGHHSPPNYGSSRRVAAAHPALDLDAALAARHAEIVIRLQGEPKFRRDAQVQAEPERRVGGDGARASRFMLIPRGFMNSSSRISPG